MAANLKKKFLEDFEEYCSLKKISKVSMNRMIAAYKELPLFEEPIDASKPLSVPSLASNEADILNNYYWNYIIDIQCVERLKVYKRGISLGKYLEQLVSKIISKIDNASEVYRISHSCSGIDDPMLKGARFVNARSELCHILWNMGYKEAIATIIFSLNRWLLNKIQRMSRPIAYVLCSCCITVSEQIASSFINSHGRIILKPSECEKFGYDNVLEHEGVHLLCGHLHRGIITVCRRNAFERIAREYPKTGFKYILLNEELKEREKERGNSLFNR